MNYLAHVYLSGTDQDLSIGNFIADHVKGKAYLDYPDSIQRGILLHRKIDHFTDSHPLFKKNVSLLFPQYRHYSRVIVDMFFDHMLAVHWEQYHPDPLEQFSRSFYTLMKKYEGSLPERTIKMIPIISRNNWFMAYGSLEGLKEILYQMSQRTRFPSDLSMAVVDLEENYLEISIYFGLFFKELVGFVADELENN